MAIPTPSKLTWPVLTILQDGKARSSRELEKILADRLNLSDEERSKKLSDGSRNLFVSRVEKAASYLNNEGFLSHPVAGDWQITASGSRLVESLQAPPEELGPSSLAKYARAGSTSPSGPVVAAALSPDVLTRSDYIVISVESRKGGVGKTTAALILAHVLAEDKFPVLFIDGDITGTNTGFAVEHSPTWSCCTKQVKWTPPGSTTSESANLLTLFTHFLRGNSPIDGLADLSVTPATSKHDHSRFPVLGSSFETTEKHNSLPPSILFDEIHSHWFRILLEAIAHKFVISCSNSHAAKPVILIIDNSPGFTGIAPTLHEWLTDLGPARGKLLSVCSADVQDLRACAQAISDIEEEYKMKHNVASWFAGQQDLFANGLSDSEMAFLTRLVESKRYSNDPCRAQLTHYTGTPLPAKASMDHYQGMILNKVIPPQAAVFPIIKEAINEKSSAFGLLVTDNSIRRRAVNYDEYLEPQFNERLLGPDLPPSRVGHLLGEIDKTLHSLNSYREWLSRMLAPVSEQNLGPAIEECRLALSRMQGGVSRLSAILSKNRFAYPARLLQRHPEWQPTYVFHRLQQFLLRSSGSILNQSRRSEIPQEFAPQKVALNVGLAIVGQMRRPEYQLAHLLQRQNEAPLLRSFLLTVALSLADLASEDEARVGPQAEEIPELIIPCLRIQHARYKALRSDALRQNPATFLAQEARLGKGEMATLAKRYGPHSTKVLPAAYVALSSSQSRLLDAGQDTNFLSSVFYVMIEMGFASKTRPFVPNLASVLEPVITLKTQTHAEGKAHAQETLAGMSYLNRFAEPVKAILAGWGIRK